MGLRLSPFLEASSFKGSERGLVLKHWCPGCKGYHMINVEKPNHSNAVWTWNENPAAPTTHPSVNISAIDDEDGEVMIRCHYFLTDGVLHFCGDCTHELSGQTVTLPALPVRPEDLEYLQDLDFSS